MKRGEFPVDGLEDDAVALYAGGADEERTLALSTAISLKRLADQGDATLQLHRDALLGQLDPPPILTDQPRGADRWDPRR